MNHINYYFKKLKSKTITFEEFKVLKNQCLKLTYRASSPYKICELASNKSILNDVLDDICTTAMLKTLKTCNTSKGSYSTYLTYKIRSRAKVEAGKLKRRYALNNTITLSDKI